jgi:hypothetical protein
MMGTTGEAKEKRRRDNQRKEQKGTYTNAHNFFLVDGGTGDVYGLCVRWWWSRRRRGEDSQIKNERQGHAKPG